MNVCIMREHGTLSDIDAARIKEAGVKFPPYGELRSGEAPHCLGIHQEGDEVRADYYIGAAWLSEYIDEAVVVLPKVDNIDFMRMFLMALNHSPSAKYFADFYGINCEGREIECSDNKLTDALSVLIIVHYIRVLQELLKAGLRKGYVIKEENLKGKVRGRIVFSSHIRKNIACCREDRIFCRYQEQTEDTMENRLLKRALLFSQRMISTFAHNAGQGGTGLDEIMRQINKCMAHFDGVSDDITLSRARALKSNKLYRRYDEALRLARMILRLADDSLIHCAEMRRAVPEFWIDMPRLYEVYVYSLLDEAYGKRIMFQVTGGHGTVCDFIKTDERMILDAKYKERYADSNSGMIDDIRQLSGYARDEKILNALGVAESDNYIPPCVIIYPESCVISDDDNDTLDDCIEIKAFDSDRTIVGQCGSKINGFKEFYKVAVRLPICEMPT